MFFGGMRDSHDRRAETLSAESVTPAELTNLNLVGIRRRLNNIEVGVWIIVLLLAYGIIVG